MPILVLPWIFPLIVSPHFLSAWPFLVDHDEVNTILCYPPQTIYSTTDAFSFFVRLTSEPKWLHGKLFATNSPLIVSPLLLCQRGLFLSITKSTTLFSAYPPPTIYSTTEAISFFVRLTSEPKWLHCKKFASHENHFTAINILLLLMKRSDNALNRQLFNNQMDSNPETSASFRCIYK